MTQKIHGAVYPGIWVEKHVAFIKVTFDSDIAAIPVANLTLLGTATPVTGAAVADSTFGVVESAIAQALKMIETKAVVLGVTKYNAATQSVDVIVGVSEGWFSDAAGTIAAGLPVGTACAKITVDGTNVNIDDIVSVAPGALTFGMAFAAFRDLPAASAAAGDLEVGVGATSGATPTNSPTGTPGYYPVANIAG